MSDLGLIGESQMGYRHVDVGPGIDAWRTQLRKSNFLRKPEFRSISGEPLDNMLLQFTQESMKRRTQN